MECPICYDVISEENKYITSCKHIFHEKCIERWFQHSYKCPMCRNSKFNISIEEYDKNYWKNNKKMTRRIENCNTEQSNNLLFKIT